MKRKRGRPPGKSYPEPHTSAEGFDIAIYGKLGASEAMSLLRDCPYPTIDFIQKKDPKKRDLLDEKLLRWAPKFIEAWLRRVGPILGEKIAAGDSEFFRDLGKAVEKFSKSNRPADKFFLRRLLAIECKLHCDATGTPFTCKVLLDHYRRRAPEHKIDSSTLSKIRRWARPAKRSYEDQIRNVFGPPRI